MNNGHHHHHSYPHFLNCTAFHRKFFMFFKTTWLQQLSSHDQQLSATATIIHTTAVMFPLWHFSLWQDQLQITAIMTLRHTTVKC
jgi:hypothetical protein